MPARHPLSLAVALVAAALAVPALAVPAAATPAAAGPAPTGAVAYAVDLGSVPGARVSVDRGARQGDGSCRFTAGGTGRPAGGRVRYVTELSFDPATCERRLATADYARGAVPAAVRARLATDRQTAGAAGRRASAAAAPRTAAAGSWSGALQVNVEDPVQINVTSTRSTLDWSYDGTTLSADHGAGWGWFALSGWERRDHRWTPTNTGTVASTDTYGKFRNGVFCFGITTWTEHKLTYFEGRPDGTWTWSADVVKSGGCNGLLHYEYLVETP